MAGVTACSADPKVQQLRSTALECFSTILDGTEGGARLGQDGLDAIDMALSEVMDQDRSSVVRAQAARILQKLHRHSHPAQAN